MRTEKSLQTHIEEAKPFLVRPFGVGMAYSLDELQLQTFWAVQFRDPDGECLYEFTTKTDLHPDEFLAAIYNALNTAGYRTSGGPGNRMVPK